MSAEDRPTAQEEEEAKVESVATDTTGLDLTAKSLQQLDELFAANPENIANKQTQFCGWIRRTRVGDAGALVFIDIFDGTRVGSLNVLASRADYKGPDFKVTASPAEECYKTLTYEQLSVDAHLSPGCAVIVDGKLVLSPPKATQNFELNAVCVRVIGGVANPRSYPISKSATKKITTLRQIPFDRFRAQVSQSLFRIRSKLELGIHIFMDQESVQKVDPNIITNSDCEGAGETFAISPLIFSTDAKGKQLPVGLTVSSQLPLEAAILGFKQVYTCQKSFRAEKSDTKKHLAEFLHIEYEGAFITMDDLLAFTERFVKFSCNYVFERCAADFNFLESRLSPNDMTAMRPFLQRQLKFPFVRIKHHDAIDLIVKLVKGKAKLPENGKMKRVKVKVLPKYDEDLGSEHEKLLVTYFGWESIPEEERKDWLTQKKEVGAFVFLTHWPLKIKSFYMKQCDDDSGECESFDLLCPSVGEMFGGSMREWRAEKLDAEIKRRDMDVSPIQWYSDLRKTGSAPHGGWGLGFARMVMLVTGVPSVRDIVPFPVYYTHCPY